MARCMDCKTCHAVSHRAKPAEVIFCPSFSQYRSIVIFRTCENFRAMDSSDYVERERSIVIERKVLLAAVARVHRKKFSASEYRVVD